MMKKMQIFFAMFGGLIIYICVSNFVVLSKLDYNISFSQDHINILADDETDGDALPSEGDKAIQPTSQTEEHQERKPLQETDGDVFPKEDDSATPQQPPAQAMVSQETKRMQYIQDYSVQEALSMKPFNNVTTAAYQHQFWSGFCNQYMMFVGMIILAKKEEYSQIIVDSIRWKDLFGTNQQIRHDALFDVLHWNSFYPELPRIVSHDAELLPDVSIIQRRANRFSTAMAWKVDVVNASKPHSLGKKQTSAVHAYLNYGRKVHKNRIKREAFEVSIARDAFRPHPTLQLIIDEFVKSIGNSYMVLHARIEPDMQKHKSCGDKKVTAFKDIIRMVEQQFEEPPVKTMVVILNREMLEKEVASPNKDNPLAAENLKLLNDLIANGLWGGKVKVVEAGSKLAIDSGHDIYSKYYAISGGIINYFISIQAEVFVGTPVSSYSTAVTKSRFFRQALGNYFYLPQGMTLATPANATHPPLFEC
mmetsp:Transcript_28478/g.42244  ORF Transcript_28478/g.42244 Transcript_28478/m.42244 type:complete len:477 (-) Transcript_28478:89-1519(-)